MRDDHDIRLRLASEQDADAIHGMIADLAEGLGLSDKFRSSARDFRRHGSGAAPAFRAIVAERNGEYVGLSLFLYNFSSWRGELGVYIQDLYVASALRRSGLGARLVAATARIAASAGATHLRLSVDRGNETAKRFYRRLGLRMADNECIFQATGDAFRKLSAQHAGS